MRRALPLLLLAACGYTFDRDRGQRPLAQGGLPSVAVMPFDNATFRRGLEIRLTRLVADEVRARSPRAPRSPGDADYLLTGSVVHAREMVLSEDRADEIRESSFVIRVQVVLENRTTGERIRSYSFEEREPFSTRAGRVATLEQAQEEALRDLAESIVYWLESTDPKVTS